MKYNQFEPLETVFILKWDLIQELPIKIVDIKLDGCETVVEYSFGLTKSKEYKNVFPECIIKVPESEVFKTKEELLKSL